jgi:outer membrane protein assembly factor BamB
VPALLIVSAIALLLPRWLDHPTIPQHTAVYITDEAERLTAVDPRTGKVLWQSRLKGMGTGAALAGDTIYTGGSAGYVHAFDAATGATRWTVKITDDTEFPASVTVDHGVVYAATCCSNTKVSHLFALRADTGATIWSRTFAGSIATPTPVDSQGAAPAAASTEVIVPWVGSSPPFGGLYALRASNGATLWHTDTPGKPYSNPVIVGNSVFMATDGGYVVAYNAATGAERWRYRPPHFEVGLSSLDGSGSLIYVCVSRTFYALSAADGSLRWRVTVPGTSDRTHQQYAPAIVKGTLYAVANNDETVYALDPASGDTRWQYDGIGYGVAMPVVDRGIAYIVTGDGGLLALHASDGKLIARRDLALYDEGPIAVRSE